MAEGGKGFFKWEDSPGLYHGCGVCGTCLNNPKARNTCYGVHCEPCVRYHATMFHIGDSHKCDSCRKSVEQHEKRHREIASLVQKIQVLDNESSGTDSARPLKQSQSAKYLSRKASVRFRCPKDAYDTDNTDTELAKSLNQSVGLGRSPSCRVKREQKKAAKLAIATDKALHRQEQSKVAGIIPRDIVRRVDTALHGRSSAESLHSAALPGEFSYTLLQSIQLHERLEKQLKGKRTIRRHVDPRDEISGANKLELQYVQDALTVLGVRSPLDGGASKTRRELVQKAAQAIFEDVELVANEARGTLKRFTAYWRYANKRILNAMIRNNQLVDWRTGERLTEERMGSED